MQSCHQASNGELLAAYCRQQVMHRPAQQLAHHISQSITADQIEMLDHQGRQNTVASWQVGSIEGELVSLLSHCHIGERILLHFSTKVSAFMLLCMTVSMVII
jgi:hypothetical protein